MALGNKELAESDKRSIILLRDKIVKNRAAFRAKFPWTLSHFAEVDVPKPIPALNLTGAGTVVAARDLDNAGG